MEITCEQRAREIAESLRKRFASPKKEPFIVWEGTLGGIMCRKLWTGKGTLAPQIEDPDVDVMGVYNKDVPVEWLAEDLIWSGLIE